MGRLGNHTARIVRPPGKDAFGDPLPGDGDETEVTGTSMQPAATTERLDDRDTVTADWAWFVPPGTDIRPTDHVRFRGLLYEVDGEPQPWDDEAGRPHHIEVQLRRVTG